MFVEGLVRAAGAEAGHADEGAVRADEAVPALANASLDRHRDAVLWKLRDLDDEQLRRPMPPSGTSLLGLVKHLAATEYGWFAETFGRETDEALSRAMLDRFVESGGNFIDTADTYTQGKSEEIVGRWLKGQDRDGQGA